MILPSITQASTISGKRVLVRVDFNVTLNSHAEVTDATRIAAALPTIKYLCTHNARIVLLSHLGRPDGKPDQSLSFSHVLPQIRKLLGADVVLIERFWEKGVLKRAVDRLKPGQIAMCENTRFHPGERLNDPELIQMLAGQADLFVLDAFGSAHRTHVSTVGLATALPAYAGLLLQKEVALLTEAMHNPKRPFLVIVGGGKTVEKIRVIERLLDHADTVFLGGAIANTFFATWGIGVGVSRVDHEMIEMARAVFWKATRCACQLILPSDVVVSNAARTTKPFAVAYNQVPGSLGIFDIGPKAIAEAKNLINNARTIIWNGPMGMYEDARFTTGTDQLLHALTRRKAHTSIIGGGDTIATIGNKRVLTKITHVSTGGAAMLEFLEKGTLPAIDALGGGD